MTAAAQIDQTTYHAAREAAAVYRPQPGYVIIAGADQRDFIQRQTTNDTGALTGDHSVLTVLTSPTAKVLDVWRLVLEPEAGAIAVLTLPGRAAYTTQYLQKRIFFMDKVELRDASAEIVRFDVFGPQMAAVLAGIGVQTPPGPGAVFAAEVDEHGVRVIGQEGMIGQGALVLAPAAAAASVLARLVEAGGVDVPPEVYDVLRVEAGLPGPAAELAGDFTPLETNLDAAISGTKGCYAGQEIIARQITYDKITRRMVGVRLEGPVPAGAAVKVEGRSAGALASVVQSPRLGWIALAVIKRPHHDPDTAIAIVPDEGDPVAGTTVALPFGA